MIMLAFFMLLMPVSAVLTGIVVWAIYRDETLEDGALVRAFVFMMLLFCSLGYGLSRTKNIHMHLDPMFRIQTQIDESPLYASIKELVPDQADALRVELLRSMVNGATIDQALLLTRSVTWRTVGNRLPWASQDAKIEWARMTAESLRELKARDAVECYRAVSHVALSPKTLAEGFSSGNSVAFQSSAVTVLRSAAVGMSQRGLQPGDVKASFDEIQSARREVYDRLEERFGKDVADAIERHRFLDLPPEQASAMCSARIYQIDAALRFPKGVAGSLMSDALRVY